MVGAAPLTGKGLRKGVEAQGTDSIPITKTDYKMVFLLPVCR
jgi:hypothetical protein